MVATVEPRVDIDGRICEQPLLLEAVSKATAYLRSHLDGVAFPAIIRWNLSENDATALKLTISDTLDGTEPSATRSLATPYMTDAYRRDMFALRVFSDLLGKRSKMNRVRIGELVGRIDFDALAEAYTSARDATHAPAVPPLP